MSKQNIGWTSCKHYNLTWEIQRRLSELTNIPLISLGGFNANMESAWMTTNNEIRKNSSDINMKRLIFSDEIDKNKANNFPIMLPGIRLTLCSSGYIHSRISSFFLCKRQVPLQFRPRVYFAFYKTSTFSNSKSFCWIFDVKSILGIFTSNLIFWSHTLFDVSRFMFYDLEVVVCIRERNHFGIKVLEILH